MNHPLAKEFAMEQVISDIALCFKFEYAKLNEIKNYTYGGLGTVSDYFQKLTEVTKQTFESKPRVYDCFSLCDAQTQRKSPFHYILNQIHCIRKIKEILIYAIFAEYLRTRALLSSGTLFPPECGCIDNICSQIVQETLLKAYIAALNKEIKRTIHTTEQGLV